MINQTAPQLPNQSVAIDGPTPSDPAPARTFDQRWYHFLDKVENFLEAIRNAPQQVDQSGLGRFLSNLIKKQMAPGVQVWVGAPYNHILRFDGKKWTFGPGDSGSGYRVTFNSPPTAAGWRLCDGTMGVNYLLSDGTLGAEDLPNTPGLYFRL